MRNRRSPKFARYERHWPVDYRGTTESGQHTIVGQGMTLNVSEGGACILTTQPVPPQSILDLNIVCDPEPHVRARVRVAWCKPDTDGEMHRFGVVYLEYNLA